MDRKTKTADTLEGGLRNAVNAELERQEVEREIHDFTRSFTMYRLRPKEAREISRSKLAPSEDPDILDQEIYDLRSRMIDVSIIEQDVLVGREHRRLQPFLSIDKRTRELVVRAAPFSGTASVREELQTDIVLMHDIDAFFHDATVRPEAFPHLRELLKGLYAFIYERLHRGKKPRATLSIDYDRASVVVDKLKFVPVDSLRDLYYENKYEQFKALMHKHQIDFEVPKTDFRKWAQTPSEDMVCAKMCQQFNADLETALTRRADELKVAVKTHFQQ